MEKPLALSSYTQGGRGKPSSATSVTVWRVRCPLVVAPIQLWTSSTNRKSLATTMRSWRLYKQEPSRHIQKSAWHRTASSGLSALVGTKCREVPRVPTSAETLRHGQSANTIAIQVGNDINKQKTNGTARHETQEWSKSRALAHIPHMEHVRGCPDTNPADSDVEEQKLATLRMLTLQLAFTSTALQCA